MGTALADHGVDPVVIEMCLGHTIGTILGSKVAEKYNMAERLPDRQRAMDIWAHMLTGTEAKVVHLHA